MANTDNEQNRVQVGEELNTELTSTSESLISSEKGNPETTRDLGQLSTVENLVFRGGGAKGLAYVGALDALHQQGVLKNIKNVAGSSAGAMTAAIVAAGGKPQLMEQFCVDNSLGDFVDNSLTKRLLPKKTQNASPNIAGTGSEQSEVTNQQQTSNSDHSAAQFGQVIKGTAAFATKKSKLTGAIASKGTHLVAAMEAVMKEAILSNFPAQERTRPLEEKLVSINRQLDQIENRDSDEYKSLIKQKGDVIAAKRIINSLQYPEYKISFRDLHTLHSVDPDKFKDLYVTGTDEKGKLQVFSHETDPDMSVALAVRISASLPGVFDPVMYKGKKYIDGGAANNLPVNIFYDKDKAYQPGVLTTIGVSCENNLDITQKQYSSPSFMARIVSYLSSIVTKMLCKLDIDEATNNQKREMLKYIDNGNLFIMVAPPISITTAQMHVSQAEREHVIAVNKGFCNRQLKSLINENYKPEAFNETEARVLASCSNGRETIQATQDFKARFQSAKNSDIPWAYHVEKTIDKLLVVRGEPTEEQTKLFFQWQEIKENYTTPDDRLRAFTHAFLASPLAEPVHSQEREVQFSHEVRKEINLLKNLPGLYDTPPDFTEEFNNQSSSAMVLA